MNHNDGIFCVLRTDIQWKALPCSPDAPSTIVLPAAAAQISAAGFARLSGTINGQLVHDTGFGNLVLLKLFYIRKVPLIEVRLKYHDNSFKGLGYHKRGVATRATGTGSAASFINPSCINPYSYAQQDPALSAPRYRADGRADHKRSAGIPEQEAAVALLAQEGAVPDLQADY